MKYELVIFDFDGVLADSMSICCEEINRLRTTHFPSIPLAHTQADLAQIYCGPLKTSLRRFGLTDEQSQSFFDQHSAAMRRRIAEVRPFDEVAQLIKNLPHDRMAIVTSAYSEAVRACLDIGSEIQILGREEKKAKSTKFNELITSRSVSRDQTLTVGDTVSDILYARDVSLPTCAVSWGYHPADYLSAFNPNHVAESPHDLQLLV